MEAHDPYKEGRKYGRALRQIRGAGDNFDFADLAKILTSDEFSDYMRGVNDGMTSNAD